jgi:hypothetical protein
MLDVRSEKSDVRCLKLEVRCSMLEEGYVPEV